MDVFEKVRNWFSFSMSVEFSICLVRSTGVTRATESRKKHTGFTWIIDFCLSAATTYQEL